MARTKKDATPSIIAQLQEAPAPMEAPALDLSPLDSVLRAYGDADADAARAKDTFDSAKATRQKQVIAFTDVIRAMFGPVTSCAMFRNAQSPKDRGEHFTAFRAKVATLQLSANELAVWNDPVNHVSKTGPDGKRVFGAAHNLTTRINNWITRLLDSADPILKGEIEVIEDADGNKAVKDKPRASNPKETVLQKKLAEIISAIAKDKDSDKPDLTGHDAILKDCKALAAKMAAAWK